MNIFGKYLTIYLSHLKLRNTTSRKEAKKKTKVEECPSCRENILVYEKAVERKVGDKTLRFCSQACADAYEEIGKKREEVKESTKLKSAWAP